MSINQFLEKNTADQVGMLPLVSGLEVLSGSEFLTVVVPYVFLMASTLSPTELVEAAQLPGKTRGSKTLT